MSFTDLSRGVSTASEGVLTGLPYAEFLGLQFSVGQDGVTLIMPFTKALIGSPQPPRLHGGSVAGLMEIASIAQLLHSLRDEEKVPAIKPIDVTVDYLRAGQPEDTYARATIVRMGRRVVNVQVTAWQSDADKPIATARMNVMLKR
ncbi:PaaI family thioesterase [Pacificimonas sp. WHA3]|uniref:PaaI family thioesterase n=1 Tax=Pacificimonas pallii TaxID=2827236 RepID=A0ABS6SCT4_9SPHN|nr:PaaI family thioesterase [Pacificimonas pallii]MBV7256229.1 PaaI family thioesterase [Pacificimonas pallii]